MASELHILSKVMDSLKEDRVVIMDNIMALLSNRDKEINLVSKLKSEMLELNRINGIMQENEHFMIQLAQSITKQRDESKKNSEGSDDSKPTSKK